MLIVGIRGSVSPQFMPILMPTVSTMELCGRSVGHRWFAHRHDGNGAGVRVARAVVCRRLVRPICPVPSIMVKTAF